MQNAEFNEIQTIITRIGNFSKFVFCGDPMQTDIKEKGKSGFKPMFDIFNNEESRAQGIFCVELDKEDIMRSGILKFIVEKLEIYKK
jgi:phosphate starvation-inducible PhoH-like protein